MGYRTGKLSRIGALAAIGALAWRLGPELTDRIRLLRGDTPIHPDLRPAAAVLPRQVVSARTLPVLRALTARMAPDTEGVEIVELPEGAQLRVHRPDVVAHPEAALLWIHGGGFLFGAAAQDDEPCLKFANELGIIVASVDYRLGPDNPYPTPLEDCYAGLKWLAAQPGIDPGRIAVGGSSAGGSLAAQLALLARDRGEIRPAFQLLMYPMLDDRSHERTDLDTRNMRIWNPATNRLGWNAYLGDADPDKVVPARRTDLAGLPPAWIGVGTLDLFHDEDLAYAARLEEAGVPCETVVIPGAFHGFFEILQGVALTKSIVNAQCEALRAALFD